MEYCLCDDKTPQGKDVVLWQDSNGFYIDIKEAIFHFDDKREAFTFYELLLLSDYDTKVYL